MVASSTSAATSLRWTLAGWVEEKCLGGTSRQPAAGDTPKKLRLRASRR
ncbi:MAG: hypothetical protein ACRDT2_09880 [Natronosporangium sp.]